MFDRLDSVWSSVRARSIEDFDYFVETVLGRTAVQREVSHYDLWQCVVKGERVSYVPSETFAWIFPELCERRKTQRAA